MTAKSKTYASLDKRTLKYRRRTTYSIWSNIVLRCLNPQHHAYSDYGGRGVLLHPLWTPSPYSGSTLSRMEAFHNFVQDVGLRPSQYHSLDRLDPNGPYAPPPQTQWATAAQQARNKRDSLFIEHEGKLIPVAELAQRLGVPYQTLRYRLQRQGRWPGNVN